MQAELKQLKDRLATMTDLSLANSILNWDQATMLPHAGNEQRGRQMATLGKLAHEILTSKETGDLIDSLIDSLTDSSRDRAQDALDAALVREAKRLRDLDVKVPSALNAEMREHYARMYSAWTIARPNNDFNAVKPLLEKSLELSKRFADCFRGVSHPLDALIQYSDRGVTVSSTRKLFDDLRKQLVPLVKKVTSAPQIDSTCLIGDFDEKTQLEFCKKISANLGYDFNRGRMDLSPHPFMTRLSGGDIRITTRARRDDLTDCLFSVIHEVGHALYELGINPVLDGNILANGVSSGVHESQSRLWENRVGRGKPFWDFFYPELQNTFKHFESVSQEQFLRAINKVEPGFIRVDADELTYNLHVMIRFELECMLIEDKLKISELPDAWNARYREDLGVNVPDMKDGCLQDVHWFSGPLGGAFQGYTIGNILSAQFFDAAARAHPDLERDFAHGNFSKLKTWLNENVHYCGSACEPDEIVMRATGSSMTIEPYMAYLSNKYARLYML